MYRCNVTGSQRKFYVFIVFHCRSLKSTIVLVLIILVTVIGSKPKTDLCIT